MESLPDTVSSTTDETGQPPVAETLISSTIVNGEPDLDEAARAFAMGKRDYAMRDYSAAVGNLAKACEIYTAIYGELADEMGDVYYFYGRALFANARSESTVLGVPIENETNECDEDEEDDEEDDGNGEVEENGKEVNEETPKTENGEQEEPADADDLQLSWEILEMAKVIFQRKADDDKEIAVKLSEVYLTLGENGLESESFETAINDIQTCLSIQKKYLPEDSRRIAETFYQLGLAYAMREDFAGAAENLGSAVKQLQKRMANLEAAKSAGKAKIDGEDQDSFYTIDHEMDEIKAVLVELDQKALDIADCKEHLKKEIAAKIGLGADGASTSSATVTLETEKKPATDINHLVRKKRKNEDEVVETTEKKQKTEETS